MRLDEYQWSRNPRGLHCASIYQSPLETHRYAAPRFGWAKLMAAGYEYVDDAMNLMALGITPIVRLYLGAYGAGPFDQRLQSWVREFARAGVKWFEFYNEPNLGVEWDNVNPTWEDTPNIIRPLMENWLNFAEYVISFGGYPGFIPLAESDTPRYASVRWMDAFLRYLVENRFERFRNILNAGMYCATHPYILNHFYQTVPGGGPLSARPPRDQRASEGGWHFEYPYDPICQADDPGRTVYGGTALTPYGDPVGLLAMGRMFNERAAAWFGAQAVPVVGTEGGIFPFRDGVFQQDTRYPPYDERSQAEATVAMFEWIARQAPPWFFGVTLWKEDDYYLDSGGSVAAIDRLSATPVVYKDVPPLEVMGTPVAPTPTVVPGPAPIHGTPDLHFVILAAGLGDEWFFETAQPYYNTFRPVLTNLTELVQFIPSQYSLAVTLIAPPSQLPLLRDSIRANYPNVWVDPLPAVSLDELRATFNNRVLRNLRFG